MKEIKSIESKPLGFVLAGYGDKMVYYDYDSHNDSLNAGKPLTRESLRAIFKVLNSKFVDFDTNYGFKGIIPKNVIRFSTDEKKIIWYSQPQVRKLYFQEGLDIKTDNYPIPYLLWKLNDNSLSIYALTSIPKNTDDKLFQAPFFNVSNNGAVCMGNAKFTNDSLDYEEIIRVAQAAFFNSYFTHSNCNDIIKGNYVDFMNNQAIKSVKFDSKKLVRYKTINNIL